MPAVSLDSKFAELAQKGEKALVTFVTAGDPELGQLPAVVDALQEGGADVIELGVPFSDPIADGPTIQAASQRALDRGVTPTAVLGALSKCDLKVPIVLMGYYNPILRRGLAEFAAASRVAGTSGTIVSDLTPEESDGWVEASRANELSTIFLAAPTSTDARLDAVASRSTGFVYAVSRTGVTGASLSLSPDAVALVQRLRSRTANPICVGFGISTPEHVKAVCEVADGAVVGSRLVTLLADEWQEGKGRARIVDWVASLKAATRA
jgi:tryptophan synthase alpha chain